MSHISQLEKARKILRDLAKDLSWEGDPTPNKEPVIKHIELATSATDAALQHLKIEYERQTHEKTPR